MRCAHHILWMCHIAHKMGKYGHLAKRQVAACNMTALRRCFSCARSINGIATCKGPAHRKGPQRTPQPEWGTSQWAASGTLLFSLPHPKQGLASGTNPSKQASSTPQGTWALPLQREKQSSLVGRTLRRRSSRASVAGCCLPCRQ